MKYLKALNKIMVISSNSALVFQKIFHHLNLGYTVIFFSLFWNMKNSIIYERR